MISAFEQHIYNSWLKHSRKGQPWQPRKDFTDFESSSSYVPLMKLSSFFRAHRHVNVDTFFEAPYVVYSKDETFYLDFYTTARAAKAYALYGKKKLGEMPDNQLQAIAESFSFIKQYCVEQKIKPDNYALHKGPGGVTYECLQHLLGHNVSVYALFACPGFDTCIATTPKDELEFILGIEFANFLDIYRTRWNVSTKAKTLSLMSFKKIQKLVENQG